MDILLINPAYINPSDFNERYSHYLDLIEKGNMYLLPFEPPLGLASLAAELRLKGFSASLLDIQGERLNDAQVRDYVKKHNPSFVGITAMTTTYPSALELAKLVKETAESARVIMGGVHPTVLPGDVLAEDCVDFIVRGEGEIPITELLQKGSPEGIPGVGYKKEGVPVIPDKAPIIKNVDSLPMPDYDSFPVEEYINYNLHLRSLKSISVIVSRGCPYDCSFCAVKETLGRGYRIRSAPLVVDEIRMLKERYGLEGIWFKDSILNLKRKWIESLCGEIHKTGLDIKWQLNTRVDLIDEKQVAMMADAGLEQIDFGIESGSPATLKTLNKETSIEKIESAVKIAKRYVKVSGFFMVGVPGENENDIEMTFELAKKLELDRASWSVFTPLPGSHLYDKMKAEKLIPEKMDWRQIHFTDSGKSYSKLPHEKLMRRFWEIQDYFSKKEGRPKSAAPTG